MEQVKTLVSVIIPSFKMGQFIGEALESVGAQTYPHWEVIVVDDAGPEDGTREAVAAFAAKYPDHRVEYIRHETNRGVSVARRTAFEASRGEYIAFLDADDAFFPEKLASYVAKLEANPECVLIHGPVVEVGAPLERQGIVAGWFTLRNPPEKYQPRDYELATSNHVCNSTVVVRRSSLKADDFARRMYFQFEDWLLWRILQHRGDFLYCPEPLTKYRVHDESFTQSTRWERGAREMAEIEMNLAEFSHLEHGRERRLAARAILDNLQSLLGAGATRAAFDQGRLAFRLRWSLIAEMVAEDLRKLFSRLGLSRSRPR